MRLNNLKNNEASRSNRKRVGRGIGSGTGKTSGKGHKGQKSRSGVSIKGFEGGQMPLYRRLPKHGFKNYFRKSYEIVNLSDLQTAIDLGKLNIKKLINKSVLKEAGLLSKENNDLKLLGKGKLKSSVNIELSAISKTAMDAIKKSGGKVSLISRANVIVDEKSKKNNKETDIESK